MRRPSGTIEHAPAGTPVGGAGYVDHGGQHGVAISAFETAPCVQNGVQLVHIWGLFEAAHPRVGEEREGADRWPLALK